MTAVPDRIGERSWIEILAGQCVANALGCGYRFRHTGTSSDMVDGYISRENIDVIAIEVTQAVSQSLREFNAALVQDSRQPGIPLAQGSGQWIALLHPSTRVRRQSDADWQRLVDLLQRRGANSFASGWFPGDGPITTVAQALGVSSMFRAASSPDMLLRASSPSDDYFLNTSLEGLVEELRGFLAAPDTLAKIKRLVERAGGLEAHFVVVSSDGLSLGARYALTYLHPEYELPTSPLELPAGLQAIWVIQPGERGLCYEATDGYAVHDLRSITP